MLGVRHHELYSSENRPATQQRGISRIVDTDFDLSIRKANESAFKYGPLRDAASILEDIRNTPRVDEPLEEWQRAAGERMWQDENRRIKMEARKNSELREEQ